MTNQTATNQNARQFAAAARLFAAVPGPDTLLNLNRHAIPLLTETREPAWKSVDAPDTFTAPFTRLRVVCDRRLTTDEALRVAGCTAYALRAILAGDDLGLPDVSYAIAGSGITFTVIEADYDSDASIRTEPDPAQAFSLARILVNEGTPARRTNRVGPCGTRLAEGVGGCNVVFFVR